MSRSSHLAAYLADEFTQPDDFRTKCNVLEQVLEAAEEE
jgi:hypothetical protein